jgi:type IV pilus assembly protein PilC
MAWRRSELRVPVYGTLVRKRALSRLSRALSMLLKCGVEVLPALTICEDVVRHAAYRSALAEIRAGLGEGQPISERLAGALFDSMFVNLVRVGEETGRLDVLLSRLADFYDDDLDAALQALTNLVEPALILLLGTAVGAIAAAILVPFYSLVGSLR